MSPTCALCLEEAELQNSHIIPEFLYEPLYDAKHRFHIYNIEGDTDRKFAQKGLREELLCKPCELQIGKYERYVSLLFRGDINAKAQTYNLLVVVSPVDAKLLRLFLLSILWRSGISKQKFFLHVSLGAHAEQLRTMLRAEEVTPLWRYGCMVAAPLLNDEPQFDLMVQPTETRVDGLRVYRYVFGGLSWAFFVASHPHPRKLELLSLDNREELRFLKTDLRDMQYAANAFRRIANYK